MAGKKANNTERLSALETGVAQILETLGKMTPGGTAGEPIIVDMHGRPYAGETRAPGQPVIVVPPAPQQQSTTDWSPVIVAAITVLGQMMTASMTQRTDPSAQLGHLVSAMADLQEMQGGGKSEMGEMVQLMMAFKSLKSDKPAAGESNGHSNDELVQHLVQQFSKDPSALSAILGGQGAAHEETGT